MKSINIWIPGQPARVTHQSGTRYSRRSGRTYKTPQLKQWETQLLRGVKHKAPKNPLSGPVCLSVTFGFKARRKKDLMTYKTTQPDTDNMIKTVKDILTRAGFWADDAQVVVEHGSKIWVDEPGIVIKIEQLGGRCEDWRIDE